MSSNAKAGGSVLNIVVAGTFTVLPVKRPLEFWMDRLEISAEVTIAPYAQVMQELLNPTSSLARNRSGANVLLIRLEDWAEDVTEVQSAAREFTAALEVLRARTSGPVLLFLCPPSLSLPEAATREIESCHQNLMSKCATLANCICLTHAEISRSYDVGDYEDVRTLQLAHIPYTTEYFASIATLITRRLTNIVKPPYKVIAVDCDNTLWKGIVGEDGVEGVVITESHRSFQQQLVHQYECGVLLCLCSKNDVRDVEAVLRNRPDMVLREEHLVSSRVNWEAKSKNLTSLAEELDLALNSFIFIDDSDVECAEVETNCPDVLTLKMPEAPEDVADFLKHCWAFDRTGVTEDARRRTAQYRENRQRSVALEQAPSLESFLESLQLIVEVDPMKPEQLTRVAELVQRTNQFNATSIRRRAGEIQLLLESQEIQVLVVNVRDRFGKYGLTGAVFLRRLGDSLEVETFVLSCRVLGRGVEQRIVNTLGRMARSEGRRTVVLRYRRTERNEPAREFLEKSFREFGADEGDEVSGNRIFDVPSDYAERLSGVPTPFDADDEGQKQTSTNDSGRSRLGRSAAPKWAAVAYRLSKLSELMRELGDIQPVQPPSGEVDDPAKTSTEITVAKIFADILGRSEVGRHGDFFDLGGDSLLAVQAIARIESVLGAELSLHDFFDAPTVEQISARLRVATHTTDRVIPQADYSHPLPLSSCQRRLWFIDRLEGGSEPYHITEAFRLRGHLSHVALQKALESLLHRHAALRTIFVEVDGEPRQQVLTEERFELPLHDFGHLSAEDSERLTRRHIVEEATSRYDLQAGPLFRARLILLPESSAVLILAMHHIVSDGWSMGILLRELGQLYRAHVNQYSRSLAPLTIQYADYAQWQRDWVGSAEIQPHLAYWKEHLRDAPELLRLPTDRARPTTASHRGANEDVILDAEISTHIRALARKLDVTVAMVLHAAWVAVLRRLSGQNDIVVGIAVANRRRSELEGLIGFFANTLPVRTRLRNEQTVTDLLLQVKKIMLDVQAHQDVPFEEIVSAARPWRSLNHSPLFQVMFVLENAPREPMDLTGLSVDEESVPARTAQFDMTLCLAEVGSDIRGWVSYATDLFDQSTVRRWAGYFQQALREFSREPEIPLNRLTLVGNEEIGRVLRAFNASELEYPQEKLIHELFEEQVACAPHAIAVSHESHSLTYARLNQLANHLARYLQQKGVRPDDRVAIVLGRELELIVAMVGVLKAGGAYVPLDPSYPPDRLQYIVNDAAPKVLLTQASLRKKLSHTRAEVIELDSQWSDIEQERGDRLDACSVGLRPDNLVYVIYTSGSTGNPKGVMVNHRGLHNLAAWHIRDFGLSAKSHGVSMAGLGFDATAWEVWPTLCSGGNLVLPPRDVIGDPQHQLRWWQQQDLDVSFLVTPLAELAYSTGAVNTTLGILLTGGDRLQHFPKALPPGQVLINNYGPTETTIVATSGQLHPGDEVLHIGKPIANAQVYILDERMCPAPIGIAGELYIGGHGVSRGYLGRPDLTAERFVASPFGADLGARLYKTGDVGRWSADGNVEYLGRNDHQVKIRGFRVELGEIEAQLARYDDVHEAVVLIREDAPGQKRLVAYVTLNTHTDGRSPPTAEILRSHLRSTLPEYMVPSAFVVLEAFPLTQNGKVDRERLPTPQGTAYFKRDYAPPQGEVEEILALIWQALLGVERIGRTDNFFELGGHSLLVVQMMERLRRVGFSAEVRSVFESSSLAELATTLTRGTHPSLGVPPNRIPHESEVITPDMLTLMELDERAVSTIVEAIPGGARNIQDIYPLAPLQEGILFHHLLKSSGSDPYGRFLLIRFSDRAKLDDFISSLQQIIDRHDVLRTAFVWGQLLQPVQVVCRRAELPVEELAFESGTDVEAQLRVRMVPSAHRLNLGRAPLMHLSLAADPARGEWYGLLETHHLVCDNASLHILVSELMTCLEGKGNTLPQAEPYRNHVAEALLYNKLHDPEAYFRGKLQDIEEPTASFGVTDVLLDGSATTTAQLTLDPQVSAAIRTQARRAEITPATLFHAVWALVVSRTSGRDDVVFGSVLLGRLLGNAGAQRILGMFINTLPLRISLKNATARELVKQTQVALIELFKCEHASLTVAQRCSGVNRELPLFTSVLNYRHRIGDINAEWARVPGVDLVEFCGWTNYPVVLSVDDLGDGFAVAIETAPGIDSHRMIAYLHTAVRSLAEALEKEPQTPALSLSILPDEERRAVIEQFNRGPGSVPQENLIHGLFEEQVQRTPDATATVFEGHALTYAELNSRANQLAHHLKKRQIGPDQMVGICVERSLEMVMGLLGILKAGGAYVPLDPGYPPERLQYMLGDAAPRALLTQAHLRDRLPQTDVEVMVLDGEWSEISQQAGNDLDVGALGLRSHHLAYVIYTSGSTGQPKGVMIEHRHVLNLWLGLESACRQSAPCDHIALNASLNFDASVQQIAQLLSGHTLFVIPEKYRRDASAMLRFLSESQIQGVDCTPSQLRTWISTGVLRTGASPLRRVLVGGEAIDSELWNSLAECPEIDFYNVYGPTECTVDSTIAYLKGDTTAPHIGHPMENRRIYVLDSHYHPAPIGVSGEIYIGGTGVARGYLNRPELSSERFLEDPFSRDPQARMYKTGDLGRWRADGNIEYLGRNDTQVKIRGFRIELGEIESRLLQYPGVKDAVVLAREDEPGLKRLAAYVTARPGTEPAAISAESLRNALKAVLPEHMVPGAFVLLDSFPLTPSGKLDRRALPDPEHGAYVSREYEAPQGELEEILAGIWQHLLKVDRVGRLDNFFELGGHSLLALKLLFSVRQRMGHVIEIGDVYRNPTLAEMAHGLGSKEKIEERILLAREAEVPQYIVSGRNRSHQPPRAVLLTGATGFVGRFLLSQLLLSTDAKVHCLVRAQSVHQAVSRLKNVLSKWNLWRSEFDQRLETISGDLGLPNLGLDEAAMSRLSQEIDSIYHCGTSVNHLESYETAKAANVNAVRDLLTLTTRGATKQLNHVSTVSVFRTSDARQERLVDERTPIDEETHFGSQGYAASKWVAERMVMTAMERGIPCNIFRLGLVWADSVEGRYDELQREYRIFKSCLLSGFGIADYEYPSAPIPVDYAAKAVVSLAQRHVDGNGIFHLMGADRKVPNLFGRCNELMGMSLELLPLYEWIMEIERLHKKGNSLPVVPLVQFAFGMDRTSFYEHQTSSGWAGIRFSCARTGAALEEVGMAPSAFDDQLVRRCVEDMCSRDEELRHWLVRNRNLGKDRKYG